MWVALLLSLRNILVTRLLEERIVRYNVPTNRERSILGRCFKVAPTTLPNLAGAPDWLRNGRVTNCGLRLPILFSFFLVSNVQPHLLGKPNPPENPFTEKASPKRRMIE